MSHPAPPAQEALVKALIMSLERWEDLAAVIEEQGSYANAGWCRATAERLRETVRSLTP